jgi:hypothetical protein
MLRAMKTLLLSSLACLPFAFLPACASNAPTKSVAPGAMSAMPDIGKMLAGIKDVGTANAAKGPLEAAIGQLKNAMGGIPAQAQQQAAASGGDLGGITKQLTGSLLSSFGLGAGTMGVINTLMGNGGIAGALGPALSSLKGLLPAM